MFTRKIYDKMLQWKNESGGDTALLIEGARRIGKSTVVEEFAKNEYESYILVDFATASKDVRELFEDVSDLICTFLLRPFMQSLLSIPRVWDTYQQAIFNRRTAGREGENTEKGTLFLCLLRNFIPYYLQHRERKI